MTCGFTSQPRGGTNTLLEHWRDTDSEESVPSGPDSPQPRILSHCLHLYTASPQRLHFDFAGVNDTYWVQGDGGSGPPTPEVFQNTAHSDRDPAQL